MIEAIEQHSADVIAGPVEFQYDDDDFLWRQQSPDLEEGEELSSAATGNIAFHSRLVAPSLHGLGLRFNQHLRFAGGEDVEFFRRAAESNCKLVWSNGPKAVEHQSHGQRQTMRWYLRRMHCFGNSQSAIAVYWNGYLAAIREYGPKGLRFIVRALFQIVFASWYWRARGREIFRIRFKKKITQIAIGAGYFSGLTGRNYAPYTNIDGH